MHRYASPNSHLIPLPLVWGESDRISLVDHADGFKTGNTFPNESDGWRHVGRICVGNDCKWSWGAGLGLMLTSCVIKPVQTDQLSTCHTNHPAVQSHTDGLLTEDKAPTLLIIKLSPK